MEVKLESEAVIVEFFVAPLPWEIGSKLVHNFRVSLANFAPVFLESPDSMLFKLGKSREQAGSYGRFYSQENTILTFKKELLNAGYSVKIQTNLNDFNDHFEVFTTDAARTLFPPIEKPRKKAADRESRYKDFRRHVMELVDGERPPRRLNRHGS